MQGVRRRTRTQQAATDDTMAWSKRGDGVTAVHADGGYAGGKIIACCLVPYVLGRYELS